MRLEWLKYAIKELQYIKSKNDFKLSLKYKLPFFLRRINILTYKCGDYPLSIQIEPTNHCNLNCICCSRERVKREKGYMDFTLFKKIIDEAVNIGVLRIHLYLHGEPMLHPDIVEMIKYIKTKGLALTMATNGTLFDDKTIELTLKSGLTISDYLTFSILGFSKEVHEKIMRGVNHEQVLRNISSFLHLRKSFNSKGPLIETVCYLMDENAHEKKLFHRYWKRIVDHVHPVDSISRYFAEYKLDKTSAIYRTSTCRNLWERMTVFWNGDVTRCVADLDGDYVFGNLWRDSIKELWNSEELQRVRIMHQKRAFARLELCAKCDWI